MGRERAAPSAGAWMALRDAASRIGVPEVTLRRRCERASREAQATAGGGRVIEFDGLRARKFGRRWQVFLDGAWLEPAGSAIEPAKSK